MSKPRASVLAAVILMTMGCRTTLNAALDLFLDLGSDIPGESKDPVHKDQVEVLAFPRNEFLRILEESPITAEALGKIAQQKMEAHRTADGGKKRN